MRRSGFTMIELIFVIVILGILAAVALPRFASIQDDANIAAEKSVIGSVRSGLTAVRGRVLANPDRDVNITFIDKQGLYHSVNIGRQVAPTLAESTSLFERNVSATGYPNALSVGNWSTGGGTEATAVNETTNLSYDSGSADDQGSGAGVLVLEPDGRQNLFTFDRSRVGTVLNNYSLNPTNVTGGTRSILTGQATQSVMDPTAPLCVGKGWIYNSVSGTIVEAGTCRQ